MAGYKLEITFATDDILKVASLAYDIGEYSRFRAGFEGIKPSAIDYGTPIVLADPVASHGKHGVADSDPSKRFGSIIKPEFRNLFNAVLDDVRATASSEPKEHSPACTCGMGIGAQPNAHHPTCSSFGSSWLAGPVLHADNEAIQPVEALADRSPGSNGAEADDKSEYDALLKSINALSLPHGPYNSLQQLAFPLGSSCAHCNRSDDLVQTDHTAPFHTVGIANIFDGPAFYLKLCGFCYRLVFP